MSAINQYIELYKSNSETINKHSNGILNDLRAEALKAVENGNFPKRGDEDYEVTDIEKMFSPDFGININRVELGVNPADAFRCNVPNMSTCMFFLFNDTFHAGKNAIEELPKGVIIKSLAKAAVENKELVEKYYAKSAPLSHAQTALNTLLAQDGVFVYVPKGVIVEKPLQLVNILNSHSPLMVNRRVLIIVEEDAQAKLLVCDHTQNQDVDFLNSQVVEIFVGERAIFDYYDIEDSSEKTTRTSSFYVHQQKDSNVLIDGITLQNGNTRNNYIVDLDGDHTELQLLGMAMINHHRNVDNHTVVNHRSKYGHTNELFKYVLDDKATGAFSGLVKVFPGAEKTEAYQSNKNICASEDARMHSKPQLLIDCDDVRCNHGSSIGQIDQNALFYMRSRGIDERDAKLMLMQAFMNDVIAGVRMENLKDRLRQLVENRFMDAKGSTCSHCMKSCQSNENN